MRCIGVAKEIVHITENLLISTDEEHTDIIGLILLQRMDRQHIGLCAVDSEVGHFAVTVTSDILQSAVACWPLVEPFDGHDGEELIDTPAVGQTLEK